MPGPPDAAPVVTLCAAPKAGAEKYPPFGTLIKDSSSHPLAAHNRVICH